MTPEDTTPADEPRSRAESVYFQMTPEHYTAWPCVTIHCKKSELDEKRRSKLLDAAEKLLDIFNETGAK